MFIDEKNEIETDISNSEDDTATNDRTENELAPKNNDLNSQKKLFWLVSIGNNSSQLILLNFFQYFAAEVGVSQFVMGFLTAIRNLVTALFQGQIGLLSDKKGRKLFLLVGFFAAFSFTTLLIFSYNAIMLILVATAQAFAFSIIIPVWNATLGDVTNIKGRTSFIGKLSSIGQGVGIVFMLILAVVFFLINHFTGWIIWGVKIEELHWKVQYGIVFGVCALGFLLAAISLIFFKETTKIDGKASPRMRTAFQNKDFRFFIIINSIFGITMAALWPIYPVIQVKILDMKMYELVIVATVYAILFSFGGFLGGRVGDRFGRKPVLLFSRLIMFSVSLIYIPAVLTGSWIYVILTNVVSGFGNGVFAVMMNAYALDLSSEETLGAYSGLTQASWGIATFIGSFGAGIISQFLVNAYGNNTMIIATTIGIAVLRVLASIGYFFIKESLPEDNKVHKNDY
ncbi:MAG: MFS transporter [Candidatus Thorarchaeota archaeon]